MRNMGWKYNFKNYTGSQRNLLSDSIASLLLRLKSWSVSKWYNSTTQKETKEEENEQRKKNQLVIQIFGVLVIREALYSNQER